MKLEGTVTTPKIPQAPQGPLWDELRKAKTETAIERVREKALAHGYSADGQLMRAIKSQLRAHR